MRATDNIGLDFNVLFCVLTVLPGVLQYTRRKGGPTLILNFQRKQKNEGMKQRRTRLISESAAISDPTGVMYPDKLCSQQTDKKILQQNRLLQLVAELLQNFLCSFGWKDSATI